MSCEKIIGGFICSGVKSFEKITLKDGTGVWFEDHKNFGPFFWLDEDCVRTIDYWDNEELSAFVDQYYKPNIPTIDDL